MNERILNNDRIYEGYKGELGKEFQLKVQKRFFWMSQKVYGESILDVGCSQGIFPILMAREGKRVVGIDFDKSAIEKANYLKSQEEDTVQNKVEFISISMNDLVTEKKFDTIILSEVLEHVFYPADMLKKAITFLNQDGVIIITVPFGINSYFDHKKTYYIYDLFKETSGILKIVDMEFFDEWIGIKCIKCNERTSSIPLEYLKKMEESLYNTEQKLHVNYHKSSIELGASNKKNTELEAIARENKNTIELQKNELQKMIELLKAEENKNQLLERQKIKFEEKNGELIEKIQMFEEQNEILKKETNKVKEELQILKKQLEMLENEKGKNMKQIKQLNNIIKGFNQRKIIKILRKAKNLKDSLFTNRLNSVNRKIVKTLKNEPKINMDFYNNIDTLINEIANSNGSNYYEKFKVKIGIITDEYMYNYYKDAVELVYIPYASYKETIEQVDMVMFVSCWHGMNNNDWRGMTSEVGRNKVIEVLDYAKKQNKKVIFQTIEDPSNYETFLPIAKHADYIFTTAREMIDAYKKDTENENVFLLDYGINPQFHNPVGFRNEKVKLKNDVFFAGSWAPRYKERCQDAKVLFDGVIQSNNKLVIADRNCNIKGYEFPVEYDKYIIPAIEHEKLQKVHKLFNWALNLNSIKYSQTMCAMRVYELQALGNLMISNYSIAVNNKFPNIFTVKNPFEVSKILNSYNEVEIYKMQVDGIRNVMSNHTVYDKLNQIFEDIDEKQYTIKDKTVLVVCDKLDEEFEKIYLAQTYKNKEVVELQKLTNETANMYDYIAYMTKETAYQRTYLEDMVNGFKYTASDFITVNSRIKDNKIEGTNHDYVNASKNIQCCVFDSKKYNALKAIKSNNIKGNGYSIDPFGVTEIKYSNFEKPELSVIVPIYNNGKFLLYKCFNSLLRSSIFNKMEILLIDDGSTDEETINTINDIKNKYENVKTYFFKDGGSGTASRPRNKGVEIANAEYITYLDPDNEAVNDGYAKLFDIVKREDYDFAFGSIMKLSDREVTFSYYSTDKEVNNPKEELIKKDFKTNSIQACVIRKDLIVNNKIENPVGAAGQDSLFFQELMINAKKVYYLNTPIHIYYAARTDSVVNSLNHKFFKKFFIMEEYQVEKLKQYNLLEEYMNRRYENFMNNWYLAKLELVEDTEEKEMSEELINKIKKLYENK